MPLVIILGQFYPPAIFTFPKHPYEFFIVCVKRTYIILCLSASRSMPVLIGGFSKEKYPYCSARYMPLIANNVTS